MWNKDSGNKTDKQIVGKIGEDCACEYLKNKGYKIIDRNYLRKWGEIDIVAQNNKKIHFVEVKSVSRETEIFPSDKVTHVTTVAEQSSLHGRQNDEYRPEDNIHPWKLKRLSRVIQSYLLDKDISDDIDWQFDVMTVYIDKEKRISRVFMMEDIIL